jgi:hypothetical protein
MKDLKPTQVIIVILFCYTLYCISIYILEFMQDFTIENIKKKAFRFAKNYIPIVKN